MKSTKIIRTVLLVVGSLAMAAAMHDARTVAASAKLAIGAMLLAAYGLSSQNGPPKNDDFPRVRKISSQNDRFAKP